MNRKISSLSHKRDSYSLYFFYWPHSPLYIGKHLQTIKVLPWKYRQSLRGVSAIWEIFIVFVFFSLSFLLRAMGIGHGLGIRVRVAVWDMDEKVVSCFSSVFIPLSYLRLDNNFFYISFVSPFTVFRFLHFFLGRGV